MRVLITGAAGFLGSHLTDRFLAEGHSVVGLDNLITGNPENIAHLMGEKRFEFIHHNISTFTYVAGKVDGVLHFASPASPVDYLEYPIATLKVGALGTHNALGLAKAKGARFFLASTSEVYGDPLEHPQRESYWGHVNPVGPRSVYDEAKRYAEAVTAAYRRSRGVDTAIARIFNTYGPRMAVADGRVIPTFIRQALDGEPLTVAGDGGQSRSLCYVEDTVDGLLRLALSNLAGPVNIGNDEETTVLRLADTVRELVGSSSPVRFVDLPEDDPRLRRPDLTTARTRLGWRPTTPLDQGLKRTVQWIAEQLEAGSPPAAAPA